MTSKEKRQWTELMSFIKYKLQHDPETWEAWKDEINAMDYNALTRWAIRMDIIDA